MEADRSGDLKYCETVQNVALWVGAPGPGLNLSIQSTPPNTAAFGTGEKPAVLENGGEGSRII